MRALPEANKQSEIRERADAARPGETTDASPPVSGSGAALLTTDERDRAAQAHVEGRK